MLVLSRKPGEKVLIGNDICLEVVEVAGNRVRIGIQAPGHVPIFREEICPALPAVGANTEKRMQHAVGHP
jgi:carbon storage regulator